MSARKFESTDSLIIRQMERIGELTASVGRAQDALTKCQADRDSWIASSRTLRADNARLREALVSVTDLAYEYAMASPVLVPKADRIILEARAALAGEGGK